MDPPKEGDLAPCPMCGETGKYKCQGKVKGMHSQKIYAFLGQKYKETGMVFRYIELIKEWKLGMVEDGEETVMYNASEEISGVEIARAYFAPGEKTQIDYHKCNRIDGKNYWDDCNLYGNANITILHHCVGRDGYLRKHNDGQSYILMLRSAKEPEIPYITVEIERDTHRLIQWYGAHDRKPDEEHMQKWLDDYVGHLKQKDAEAKQRAQSVA